MSHELLILRHAKSDWHAGYGQDIHRPLNKRGRRQATLVGEWLGKQQLMPQMVICSPARRTMETLELVMDVAGEQDISVDYRQGLYLAGLSTLLEQIGQTPDSISRLMIVGHNPGMEDLLIHLSRDEPEYTHSGKLMTTANLAWLELARNYQQPAEHSAVLKRLIRPGDLE